MSKRKTSAVNIVPPGANNPIGTAGGFNIGGGAESFQGALGTLGSRINARGMAYNSARAIIEATKIEAAARLAQREMELQAAAEAQQREHESAIKLTRINNNHEIKKATAASEQGRLDQLQSTNNVHGVLDRMVSDFPDSDLDFTTERGQTIKITRPKGASSEDSEGGSSFL